MLVVVEVRAASVCRMPSPSQGRGVTLDFLVFSHSVMWHLSFMRLFNLSYLRISLFIFIYIFFISEIRNGKLCLISYIF
jgi:hypothetical protein